MGDGAGQGFGQTLRKAREERGLSAQDLAESTRIRLSYLEALEAEDWGALPGGVTGRGFVRSLAQQLGLPAEDLLAEYRAARGAEEVSPLRPLPKAEWEVEIGGGGRGIRPVLLGFLLLLGAALGIWLWSPWSGRRLPPLELWTSGPGARPPDEPPETADGLRTQPALPQPPVSGEGAAEVEAPTPPALPPQEVASQAPAEKSSPESSAPTPAAPTTEAVSEAPRDAEPPPPPSAPSPVPEILRLEIRAVERTWIRVVSDSGQPQERILGPGDDIVLEARNNFDLKLGNAGGVRLFWNGEALKVPGRPGQVANLSLPESLESLRP
jgi:cytoskeleton protein RodZ